MFFKLLISTHQSEIIPYGKFWNPHISLNNRLKILLKLIFSRRVGHHVEAFSAIPWRWEMQSKFFLKFTHQFSGCASIVRHRDYTRDMIFLFWKISLHRIEEIGLTVSSSYGNYFFHRIITLSWILSLEKGKRLQIKKYILILYVFFGKVRKKL